MASDFDAIIRKLRTDVRASRGVARYPLVGVRKVIADQVAMFKERRPIEEIYNYVAGEANDMRSALLHIYALNIACQMHEEGEPCFTRIAQHTATIRRLRGTQMHTDRSALRHSSPEGLGQIELYTRQTVSRLGRNQFNDAVNAAVDVLGDLSLREKRNLTPPTRRAHAPAAHHEQLAS